VSAEAASSEKDTVAPVRGEQNAAAGGASAAVAACGDEVAA
jgi:hypothetical protein